MREALQTFLHSVEDAYSVMLRSHLSTSAGLFAVSAVTSLSAGPIMTWTSLEPALIDEGVFAGPGQLCLAWLGITAGFRYSVVY